MDTLIIEPKTARDINDDFFILLTRKIREGLKTPNVSHEEILKAVNSGKVSPNIVEDLEDAILVSFMEENPNDSESVRLDEVLSFLRQK